MANFHEQRRQRRTRAQWARLVAAQAASGLSVEAFCAEHDLGVTSFKRWRRRVSQPLTPAAFVEVPAPSAPAAPEGAGTIELELELAEGIRLRLRRG